MARADLETEISFWTAGPSRIREAWRAEKGAKGKEYEGS